MPFRSEAEHVREQVRRIEEEARELEEERARLDSQLAQQRQFRPWHLALIAAVLAMGAVGYAAGALYMSITYSKALERQESLRRAAAARRDAETARCESKRRAAMSELAACVEAQGRPHTFAPPPTDEGFGPPFDRGAAAAALGAAQSGIRACFSSPENGRTFHLWITFASTGEVQTAEIDTPFEGSDVEKACVLGVVRRARVPRFGGAPVRVGKRYTDR